MQSSIRAALMRGGTSRGLIFLATDLPSGVPEQDQVLLAAMGSPDPYRRQTDGVGGATSSTSKVAILAPSSHPDIDVEYTFAQVDIERPLVDRAGNCGNLSSAVGPFALDHGWVPPTPPLTRVTFVNTNTGKLIVAHVPTKLDGSFEPEGEYKLAGVPGTGSRIDLDFLDPGGAVTGRLLPTGSPTDWLRLPDGSEIEVSIVDAGNPVAFVRFADVGFTGDASPEVVDSDASLLGRLESIRAAAAVATGIAVDAREATKRLPSVPKLAFIGPPTAYALTSGHQNTASDVDLLVKSMSMGRMHRAYQLTAAICTAVAACISGTLVEQAVGDSARRSTGVNVRLGHPSGIIELSASAALRDGGWRAETVTISRTARLLMAGHVFVPAAVQAPRPSAQSLISS